MRSFKSFIESQPLVVEKQGSYIRRLQTYEQWLMEMALFPSGKFSGKDHTVVGLGYLIWLRDNWNNPEYNMRQIKSVFTLKDIDDEIRRRNALPKETKPEKPVKAKKEPKAKTEPAKPALIDPDEDDIDRTKIYILATLLKNADDIPAGSKVAVGNNLDNSWSILALDGEGRDVPAQQSELQTLIRSEKDAEGKIVRGTYDELMAKIKLAAKPEPKKKGNILSNDMMTDEQKAIDKKFESIILDGKQDHMVISALAGTGKTTMLKHLAAKYGKMGQKWLYLVFNTKNKVEAKSEFPAWVEVHTTNSFLGNLIEHMTNKTNIKQTKRIATLYGEGDDFEEKADLIVESPKFASFIKSIGLPAEKDAKHPSVSNKSEKTILSIIKGINYNFKNEVVRMAGLAKSFALDHRHNQIDEQLNNVFDKYDVDSGLSQVKERISNYDGGFRNTIESALKAILGYDFMQKDYLNEIKKSVKWVMHESMPDGTDLKHNVRGTQHDLKNFRDFTDDLWFAAVHAEQIKWPKFDFVLADEVQDFNEAQKVVLKKLHDAGAKIVAVGDKNQCHPAGTMISLTGGKQVPIEEVKIGDEVVSYNSKKSYFPGTNAQGRKVLDISSRSYSGDLIQIETPNGYKHECTPNHKCMVRFNAKGKYVLYLMTKGEKSRIGICRVDYTSSFGLTHRATQEQADRCWMLDIYDTEREAKVAEYVTAYKFGVPQLIFQNRQHKGIPQDYINEVYDKIGNNLENAYNCLESFGRLKEFPLWTKEKLVRCGVLRQNYIGSKKSFVAQACNLISNYMEVRTFDGHCRSGEWMPAKITRKVADDILVYSLKVQPAEDGKRIYIANNIATHNSIYRFRGSDAQAFDNLTNMLGDLSSNKNVKHTLSKNFRSRKAIIDYANEKTHVNNLIQGKQFDDGDGAVTEDQNYDDVFEGLGKEHKSKKLKETAFISRTNEPLANAALKLLYQGIPFVILGKDISGDLIKHINKIIAFMKLGKEDHIHDLRHKLTEFESNERDKHEGSSAKRAYLQNLKELTGAIVNASTQFEGSTANGTIAMFIKWLANKLGGLDIESSEKDLAKYKEKLEKEHPIILTTAHKSKGLQFSRTYILRNDLWPHPKAERPEDLEQEANAKYVAYTRAKDELHILALEGQPGYEKKK